MKHVICILILCLVSVLGRVADIGQKDEISNVITDVKPLTQQSIINNTTVVKNDSDNTVHENLIHENNNNTTKKTCGAHKDISDNLLDANHTETSSNEACEPEARVDNGTALILTPYLKEGRIREAKKAARVDAKPFLGFKSYSGFFTVNETYNSNIFFWYFPVLNKPVNSTPWIIWLQGGPGASSMTGLFDEIGPFTIVNETLKRNPYTWLHNHSLLFIDNPVGTGYSFTEHTEGYTTNMATYASHLYMTLYQFLQMFPELRTAPLYLAGESYAGKYVPAMAMEIHKRKDKLDVNLEGLIIGNAYVDPEMISHIAWPFYYFGLLEKEQIETVKPLIDSFQAEIKANRSIEAKNKWNSLITVLLFITHQKHAYNFLKDELPVGTYVKFLKTSEVKRAIHVGDINFGWVNMTVNVQLAPDFLSSTKPMFERLLEHYKVLAYCFTSSLAKAPALILTQLIKKNLVEQAKNLSLVDPKLFLNRTSYSGFFTVDEKLNSNLFFWYFPAENYRPDTPWILWLQGGPGSTSLAGLFDEIGPFEFTNNQLKLRQSSWGKDHSLLFIDNPVGAGFSFTDSPEGFVQDMATCSSHLYSALRQFRQVFPEVRKAPLYIAGESYAGRYLPALGVKILEQDRDIGILDVDLQGIIMGNPVLSRDSIADYSSIYYQWGLIDSQGLQAVKPLQDSYNKAILSEDSTVATELREQLLNRLDDISMQQQTFNILLDEITHLDDFTSYIRRPEVSEALHVGSIQFAFHNGTAHKRLTPDFLSEVRSKVEMLLNHYRVLIYCGQMDLTAPCVPNAKARRKHWHWNHREQFLSAARTPWWFGNRVAGYVKSGGSLTEVLVRGAGHLVPMDKPAETLALITNFIKGIDLPLPINYHALAQDTAAYIDDDTEGISKTILQIPGDPPSGTQAVMVVSIVLNVLLILAVVCGVVYGLRWKRRTDAYLYNNVDETSYTSTMF